MQRKKWISLLLVMALLFSSSVTVAATKPDTEVTRVQEVTSLRETDSETYLMSDGTYQCVVYAGDKYYEDSTGSLQLIDNSIKLDAATALSAEKQYVNTANAFDVSFTEGSTPQISIGLEGKSVTFSPLSATGGNSNIISTQKIDLSLGKVNTCDILNELACTGSNTVTYSDVFYNTDLVYVLDNAALKEYIILENENAPNAFSFLFSMDGLTMRTGEDTAAFRDTAGKDVFALDSLFAIDSNGVQTEALTYTFTPFKDTGKMIVTVTLDPEYLAAEDRVFPVVIDPTITVSSAQTADTFISEAYPNNNYYLSEYLRTGKDTTYGRMRSYLKFNIPSSIPSGGVTAASLDMEKTSGAIPTVNAYRCHYSWSSSTLTWANRASSLLFDKSPVSQPFSSAHVWYTIDVTNIVQKWVNGTEPNYGFVVAEDIETSTSQWTVFYSSDAVSPHKPELIITYTTSVTPPVTPATPSVNLMLQYDGAYALRYGGDAYSRILRQANEVKSFYQSRFGITVNVGTPIAYTSYADTCGAPYNQDCPHDGDTGCVNSVFTGTGEPTLSTFHHKNIHNICLRIPVPTNTSSVKMTFVGHETCEIIGGFHFKNDVYGLAYPGRNVMTVHNLMGEDSEKITAIHEFGHMFGALDHSGLSQTNGYNPYCIYGAYSEYDNVVENILICDACKNIIDTNKNRYSG